MATSITTEIASTAPSDLDAFPWHLAVHDAHCHPTDTMAQAPALAGMRAASLTIMATRSEDQHLVAQLASSHPDPHPHTHPDSHPDSRARERPGPCFVVPSFGWHPWFSHQLYDDEGGTTTTASSSNPLHPVDKTAHYQAVLQPVPEPEFIASLPEPAPLSGFLAQTRQRLRDFPVALVGEVGLDKGFRLPQQWEASGAGAEGPARDEALTPGSREGRLLSPYKVRMAHQQRVLEAQLKLAGELGRAVSVHSVQAHGVLFDVLSGLWRGHERKVLSRREKRAEARAAVDFGTYSDEDDEEKWEEEEEDVGGKPYPPRMCLHSYSGSADMLKQWFHPAVPCRVFLSFSVAVNIGMGGGRAKLAEVLRAVPDDRLLVESDLHAAGTGMDAALEEMYRFVCEVKGWDLESGVRRIGRNYEHFVYGSKVI